MNGVNPMADDDLSKIAVEEVLRPLKEGVLSDLRYWLRSLPWLARVNIVIAGIILGGVSHYYEALAKWISLDHKLSRVLFSPVVPPLEGDEREDLDRAIANKSKQLFSRLDQSANFDVQAWTTAEIILALPDKHIDKDNAISFFNRNMGPAASEFGAHATFAWRKWPTNRYPPSITVSSWVLLAMAQLEARASDDQIGFVLDNQMSNGGWPVYPISKSTQSEMYSSADATATAVWALSEQLKLLTPNEDHNSIETAIRRGASWLFSQADQTTAHWKDYPSGRDLLAVSGFVLHVLHKSSEYDLAGLDRVWLKNLPAAIPRPDQFDSSNRTIFSSGNEPVQTDDTRYYTLPWLVAATLDAYPSGNPAERAFALARLESIFATHPLDTLKANDEDDWIVALCLIGIHGLNVAEAPTASHFDVLQGILPPDFAAP
jgi:hypothetical protein